MVACCFSVNGRFGGGVYKFKAEDYRGLVDKMNFVQDLGCLVRMGAQMGTEADQPELAKLDKFLQKYYSDKLTHKDMERFYVNLSTGTFCVTELADTDEEYEAFCKKYPDAR